MYVVIEPLVDLQEQRIYSLLMENLYFSLKPLAKMDDPLKYIGQFIWGRLRIWV
ncbi:MAG: hypothetical protein ACPLKZ_01580 [Candidatus Bathyarchaeales archaeon]